MKKSNVWLVDDDEIYLFITESILKDLSKNLQVDSFMDGGLAIRHIEQCIEEDVDLPELILLDINMPFLDGWGFLTKFKELKPKLVEHIHIIMVTSSNDQRDLKRAYEFQELTGYVVKPVFEDKLAEILEEVYQDDW